jgi:hypothetical protein
VHDSRGSSHPLRSEQHEHDPGSGRSASGKIGGVRGWALAFAAAVALTLLTPVSKAAAQPHSVGAELWGQLDPNVGLIIVEASTRKYPYVDAEALIWGGAGSPQYGLRDNEATFEALVVSLKVRDARGISDARLGRFILGTGAVRAQHIDGGHLTLRAPSKTHFEIFGGVPVDGNIEGRRYDWIAGARVSQGLGKIGVLGGSYYNRYNAGQRSDEEVGVDFSLRAASWLDMAAKFSWEIVNPGLAEVLATISSQTNNRKFRGELFASKRNPTRFLQQTSLFTVLGDLGTLKTGANLFWRAAPRLDLTLEGAGQQAEDQWGWTGYLRGVLRTDDEGKGSVLGELRRQQVASSRWTGIRLASVIQLFEDVHQNVGLMPEFEVIIPDDRNDITGKAWPWGRLALRYQHQSGWSFAAAAEASANHTTRLDVRGLARVSYQRKWHGKQ